VSGLEFYDDLTIAGSRAGAAPCTWEAMNDETAADAATGGVMKPTRY